MKDQQLDVALMNYLPEYSGFTEIDGFNLNGQILKLMPFLERFLKKGGTFVCKAMEFSETKELTVRGSSFRKSWRTSSRMSTSTGSTSSGRTVPCSTMSSRGSE